MSRSHHSKKRSDVQNAGQGSAQSSDKTVNTDKLVVGAASPEPMDGSQPNAQGQSPPVQSSHTILHHKDPRLLVRAKRFKQIGFDVSLALGITAILLVANQFLEKTDFGTRLELMTYNWTQHRLSQALGQSGLPVVVVDISDEPGTNTDQLTSRKRLKEVISAITAKHPRAIGVDIDCSPQSKGDNGAPPILTEEETDFYAFCLKLSTQPKDKVPIYLGVDRTATLPSSDWLWTPEYAPLAVALRIPSDERFTMWKWIEIKGADRPLKSLSAALVESEHSLASKELPRWLRWAMEVEEEHELDEGMKVQRFLVDYSPLERLASDALPEGRVLNGQISEADFAGKIVLIGNSSDTTFGRIPDPDRMPVPDRTRLFPGILIHGCAVYTLLQAPLYEFTELGRVAIDLTLVLAILGTVMGAKLWRVRHDEELSDEHEQILYRYLTLGAVVLTCAIGILFVHTTRIMWDDFLFVVFGLLLHNPAEKFVHKRVPHLRKHGEEEAGEAKHTGVLTNVKEEAK